MQTVTPRALLRNAAVSASIPIICVQSSLQPSSRSQQALKQPSWGCRSMPGPLRLVLLGDIMLGRYVDDGFTCDASRKTAAFGNVLPFLRGLDPANSIVAGNLECAVTSHSTPTPKAFNFKLAPSNADVLQQLRLGFVATANNHVLDYGQQGLQETNEVLDRLGIPHAGAGTQPTASQPAVVTTPCGHRVAFLSYSDHYDDWAATAATPGINFIDPSSFDPHLLQQQVAAARAAGPDLVVVLIHWGPNWRWQPDKQLRQLGRVFLEAGADLVFGTSPHHVQGVEVVGHKAIIYSGGSFIDDYAGDARYRNDLSAVMMALYAPAPLDGSAASTTTARAAGEAGQAGAPAAAGAGAGTAVEAGSGACDAQQVHDQARAVFVADGSSSSSSRAPAGGLVLQELTALPIAISHIRREEGGPFEKAGCGNPAYFSHVDFAEDQDWDWVANKLQQLSDALGSSRVTVLPDRRGVQLFRAAVEGPGEQAAAGCGAGRRGAAVMVVHEKGQADSG